MIRFAIWCAVSRESQAGPDKISLPDQETRCRAAALAKGWQESAGPYILPGESRSIYINLSDAESAIPELRQMLIDARHGRFDVLVMIDYNRLRELIDQVARTLAAYKVQVFSVVQPVEPQPPDRFDQYSADGAWIMQYVAQIISRAQLHDLRRKYKLGMPARVRERGLPAISIPFGYRKPPGRETDRAAIPVQDPTLIPLLLKIKDLLFQGRSLRQLVQFANATGIKSPRGKTWSAQTIRDILRNPFYAGYNRWGLSKNYTDPRTAKRYRNRDVPLDEIIVQPGHHQPLWDDETHQRILRELDQRGNAYRGKSAPLFSRLLSCSECGATLWMQHNGSRAEPDRAIWRCPGCKRAAIHSSAALNQVSVSLRDAILGIDTPPNIYPPAHNPTPDRARLDELHKRRERLVDIYQDGGLTKPEYLARRTDLDKQIAHAENELTNLETRAAQRAERLDMLRSFSGLVNDLPAFFEHGDPQEINRILRLLLEKITVEGERVKTIKFLE